MGGNALGFETLRLNANEYHKLAEVITDIVPGAVLIPSYRQKPNFGDMDLLYEKGLIEPYELKFRLEEHFELQGESKNGDVLSVGVNVVVPYSTLETFQLDFIGVPADSFNFSYNYFSYNDMGNLLGRVARRIGLKFGHKGLFYIQRDGDQVLKEHLLTNKFSIALDHLGYDVDRYYEGFDTLEDMFKFVMSSRFYDFNKFDLSQRNHKARIRDEKRPNYRAFLEYATKNPKVQNIMPEEGGRTYAFGAFPQFYKDYFEILDAHNLHKEFKAKYNGNLVMRVTGLQGKELGNFMNRIKPFMIPENIKNLRVDVIENIVGAFYRNYYPNENKTPSDMTGTTHKGCAGVLLESSLYDDLDGKLTCTYCKNRVNRWS